MINSPHQSYSKDSNRILIASELFFFDQNNELQVELEAKNHDLDYELNYLSSGNLQRLSPKYKEPVNQIAPIHNQDVQSKKSSRTVHPYPDLDQEPEGSVLQQGQNESIHQSKPKSTYNSMMLYFHLKQVITKLQRNTSKVKNINELHLDLLADKASEKNVFLSQVSKDKPNSLKRLVRMIQHGNHQVPSKSLYYRWRKTLQDGATGMVSLAQRTISRIPLITPESNLKLIWDSITTSFRLIYFILIPVEISFDTHILFEQCLPLTIVVILLIAMDFAVRLNTICYRSGIAVKERWQIISIQLSNTLVEDVLSIAPLILLIVVMINLRFLMLFFFLQYGYTSKAIEQLEDRFFLSKKSQSIFTLIKLIIALLYILHIFSCIWFFISYHSGGYNWIVSKGIENATWEIQYLEAFYYATITMLTIGYGDSVPITGLEKIFAIFFMLAACIWLSYSVNIVGSIVTDMKQQKDEVQMKIRVLNRYMQRKHITYALQYKYHQILINRIKEYLNYLWSRQYESEIEKQDNIINELTNELKEDLISEAHQVFVQGVPFFNKNFSASFKAKLIPLIRSKLIYPEAIFDTSLGESNDLNICYLDQGQVQLLASSQGVFQDTPLPMMTTGQSFGTQEFIIGRSDKVKQMYKSAGFTQVLHLLRNDFLKLIKEFPEDEESFYNIKTQLEFHDLGKYKYVQCPSCSKSDHTFNQCPLLHYVVDRELIIKKYQFDYQQARQQKHRMLSRSNYHSLKDFAAIQDYSKIFIDENNTLVERQSLMQLEYNQEPIKSMESSQDFQEDRSQKKYRHESTQKRSAPRESVYLGSQIQILQVPTQNQNRNLLQINNFQATEPHIITTPTLDSEQRQLQFDQTTEERNRHKVLTRQKTFVLSKKHSMSKQNSSGEMQSLQLENRFNDVQYQNIQKLFEKFRNNSIECIELELLALKMLNRSDYQEDFKESYKNFKIYLPNNNISRVLQEQGPMLISNTNFLRLNKYMLYPMEFIKKYSHMQTNMQPKENQLKSISKQNPFKSKMKTRTSLKKSLNTLKVARTMTSSKFGRPSK